MRRILAIVLFLGASLAVAAVLVLAPRADAPDPVVLPQDPMPARLLVGLQDDPAFRWGPDRSAMLDQARDVNAAVLRTIVAWSDVAPTRPSEPADPFDPAYRLDDVDDLARSAQQRGMELLLTIWGTPGWANGDLGPNHPPNDASALEDFASALADRYSGRHPGYPAVRLFSAWNEPNLEQFLAPQFDRAGRSVGPRLYERLARAIYDGVKRGNPDALVAVGETSPRGHDVPTDAVQDSHSPARFARLLAQEAPELRFDAWAQHPYPAHPNMAPEEPVRWPRVGLGDIERFGAALDAWFSRTRTPIWVTEYAHETLPREPLGIAPELQARYARDAMDFVAHNPRIRLFVWFGFRDRLDSHWQSGLLWEDSRPKPALAAFAATARRLDGRNPSLPSDAEVARVPVLELAYHVPAGTDVEVTLDGSERAAVPLERDGWLAVPLGDRRRGAVQLRATGPHGQSVVREVRID